MINRRTLLGAAGASPLLWTAAFRPALAETPKDTVVMAHQIDDIISLDPQESFEFSGNEVTMTNPTGQTYTAKLDGTDAPVKGDPGVTSVSVKMLAKNTLQEIYKRDGKPISVIKTTLDADGKSVHVVAVDKLHNTTTGFKAVKQ